MRPLILLIVFGFGLFSSRLAPDCQAQVQVTVDWNLSTNANIVGYDLAWGTNSGVYFATNTYAANQTNGTITNLVYSTTYYMAVAAFGGNGTMSPFSTELTFITNAPTSTTNGSTSTNGTTGSSGGSSTGGTTTGGTTTGGTTTGGTTTGGTTTGGTTTGGTTTGGTTTGGTTTGGTTTGGTTTGGTTTGGTTTGGTTTTGQGQAQVTVVWNLSSNANVVGYYLAWGTNSGVYFATNTYAANQTNGTITNLAYSTTYYMAVASFGANGQTSPFSTELTFNTNAPTSGGSSSGDSGPPPPPPGSGKSSGGKPPAGNTGTGSTGTGGSTGGSGSGSSGASSSTNITQAQIWGIPPFLGLAVTNSQLNLNIGGTVGATVLVQSTTNPTAHFSWTTMTNVALTNIAPIASDAVPGQPQDPIDLAYVPSAQIAPLPTTTAGARMQFFRVLMPYDYIVLASMVLPAKGYPSRLIMVNMPGLTDDGCYVGQSGSFIHFCPTNTALQLEPSGSTIRQIATTMANNLNLDWTTASEFTYSNGMGEILATVVETDPASSDPVAGTNATSSIVINF